MVVLYQLFPLYPEERELEISKGLVHLVEQFHRLEVDLTIDLHRVNVATCSSGAGGVDQRGETNLNTPDWYELENDSDS